MTAEGIPNDEYDFQITLRIIDESRVVIVCEYIPDNNLMAKLLSTLLEIKDEKAQTILCNSLTDIGKYVRDRMLEVFHVETDDTVH